MKAIFKELLGVLFFGLVLPGLMINAGAMLLPTPAPQETTISTQPPAEKVSLPVLVRSADGSLQEQDLDTYLIGVVLAEMPANFEPEALKAQAVAARTYARKAYVTGGKHGDGSVCTKFTCCQAYLSPEAYREKGGTEQGLAAVTQAVAQTSGAVLTYEGQLIEATYFSCSGGRTEDAAAVWGTEFPYLQAVDSPGEEKAVHYTDSFSYSAAEFAQLLELDASGDPAAWFQNVHFTPGGGVDTISICGQEFTGILLRSKLSLPSTSFSVQTSGDTIVLTTYGYGHRVGMSQYGADAMAVSGSSYREILAHYYPGTEVTLLESEA